MTKTQNVELSEIFPKMCPRGSCVLLQEFRRRLPPGNRPAQTVGPSPKCRPGPTASSSSTGVSEAALPVDPPAPAPQPPPSAASAPAAPPQALRLCDWGGHVLVGGHGGLGAGMLGPEKQKHTFLVGFFVGPAHAQGIVKRTGSKKIGWPVVSCGQPLPNRTATGDDRPKFARLFEGVGFNFRVCKHLRPSRSTFLHWSLQGTQRTQRTVRQW